MLKFLAAKLKVSYVIQVIDFSETYHGEYLGQDPT